MAEWCDIAVVGAGPAGLALSTRLAQSGVDNIVLLDREPDAGGIPRHCGHPPFGFREFRRCMTGPAYAGALLKKLRAAGIEPSTLASVAEIRPGPELLLSTPLGTRILNAKKVVLATGVRETPRAARLISGQRPLGVVTTGALQSMVYLKAKTPFYRPVIVGSELVSYSALLTCRHAGIKPVALVENGERPIAWRFAKLLPLLSGIPSLYQTRVRGILGKHRVEGVELEDSMGEIRVLACDGVVFTGQFQPEASLLAMSHLKLDPASGGPVVDQYGRCSDPDYFAAGNLLRPVETAGWCWQEGRNLGPVLQAVLKGTLGPVDEQVSVCTGDTAIKYIVPQRLSLPLNGQGCKNFQLRFTRSFRGRIFIRNRSTDLWSGTLSTLPERRVLIPVPGPESGYCAGDLEVTVK